MYLSTYRKVLATLGLLTLAVLFWAGLMAPDTTEAETPTIYFDTVLRSQHSVAIDTTGIELLGEGVIWIPATTTPTVISDKGSIYCKADGALYFQDPNAGAEYVVSLDGVHTHTLESVRVVGNELSGPIDFNNNAVLDTSSVSFNGGGAMTWNTLDSTVDLTTSLGPVNQLGQEIHIKVYNDSGAQIDNGTAVYPTGAYSNFPTIGKAQTDVHTTVAVDYGMTTMDIPNGQYGFVTWFGKVRGVDTSAFSIGDPVYISATTAGEVTNVRPSFPNYAIQIGIVFISDAVNGEIFVTSRDTVKNTFDEFHNGTFRESFTFTVTSDGATITGSLSPANGNVDMTMLFSDGFTLFDTSPAATIALTAGTDAIPQTNYVYIPKATKVLTVSTSDWPTTEHIRVAQVYVQSAATVQTNGALRNQNWNDHVEGTNLQGHLAHMGARMRALDARHESGTEATFTVGAAVTIQVTAGKVKQMHPQDYSAFDTATGDHVVVINDSVTANKTLTDLVAQTLDASGDPLLNTSFSLVFWGVCNSGTEVDQLMVNLPSGTYNKNFPEQAVSDANNKSVYSIPEAYTGTGFLIARATFVNNAGTWTLYDNEDLRGKYPNSTAGGGAGGGGVTTFLGLTDTPSAYTGEAGTFPKVIAGETALEFSTLYEDPNGFIGVGTVSPNEQATIEGVLSLKETTAPSLTSGYGKLYIKASDSLPYHMDDSGTETPLLYVHPSDNYLPYVTGSPSDNEVPRVNGPTGSELQSSGIHIDDNVRLGINETVPDTKLHVNGGTDNDLATFESTDATADIFFKDNADTHSVGAVGAYLTLHADPDQSLAGSGHSFYVDGTEVGRWKTTGLEISGDGTALGAEAIDVNIKGNSTNSAWPNMPSLMIQNTQEGSASVNSYTEFRMQSDHATTPIQLSMGTDGRGAKLAASGSWIGSFSDHQFSFIQNNAVAATIDADSQFGVGTQVPGYSLVVEHATDNTIAQLKSGDAGSYLLLTDDTDTHQIGVQGVSFVYSADPDNSGANSKHVFYIDGAYEYNMSATSIYPQTDNADDLGITGTKRWKNLYVMNTPVGESDEDHKQDITPLQPTKVKALIEALTPVKYKWKQVSRPAVYELQEVQKTELIPEEKDVVYIEFDESFQKYVQKSKIETIYTEREVFTYEPVFDPNGDPIWLYEADPNDPTDVSIQLTVKLPVMETKNVLVSPEIPETDTKWHYGLTAQALAQALTDIGFDPTTLGVLDYYEGKPVGIRYSELICVLIDAVKLLSAQNDARKAEINALESRVEILEAVLTP